MPLKWELNYCPSSQHTGFLITKRSSPVREGEERRLMQSLPQTLPLRQDDFRQPAARVGWGQTTRGSTSLVTPSQALLTCHSFVLKMTSNTHKLSNNLSTSSILRFKLWHFLLLNTIFCRRHDFGQIFKGLTLLSLYFSQTVFQGSGHCNTVSITKQSVMNNLLLS